MAFNSIVIGSKTYVSVGLGEYSLSTLTFGQPMDRFKISPAKTAGKNGPVAFSVTRVMEKDVTVGSDTVRKRLTATCQISAPVGFLANEVAWLIDDLDAFLYQANIDRLLLGEN